MDIQGRVAVKKPLLRKQIVKKRLKFAREHLNWTPAQWRRVLWTDESKFELFGNKRRVFIRQDSILVRHAAPGGLKLILIGFIIHTMIRFTQWSWYEKWSEAHRKDQRELPDQQTKTK